jgi:hypothetical protein
VLFAFDLFVWFSSPSIVEVSWLHVTSLVCLHWDWHPFGLFSFSENCWQLSELRLMWMCASNQLLLYIYNTMCIFLQMNFSGLCDFSYTSCSILTTKWNISSHCSPNYHWHVVPFNPIGSLSNLSTNKEHNPKKLQNKWNSYQSALSHDIVTGTVVWTCMLLKNNHVFLPIVGFPSQLVNAIWLPVITHCHRPGFDLRPFLLVT